MVVRYFPGSRRRWIAASAAFLVAISVSAAPYASADDLEDKKDKVEKRIDGAHDDLDHSSKELRRATIKLRNTQSKLSAARTRLGRTRGKLTVARVKDRRMQAELERAEAKLRQAQADLREGRRDVQEKSEAVGERIAETYEHGDPQLRSIHSILETSNPADVTRTLATTDAVVDAETDELSALKAAEVMLEVNESNTQDQRDLVENKREAAAENLDTMQTLERRATRAARSVQTLVVRANRAQSAAARVRARDRKILQELEADKNRIEEKLRRRAAAAAAKNQASEPADSGGFLDYPVHGYVTSPYGYRTHPIYGYYSLHDGTDFGADCGTPLLAAADGTVMESYYSDSYGNRMVLDHGHVRGVGLATIYNHATHYTVSPGEHVSRGQVIGYVGSTGWSTGCHLHFTVMENGSTVDPMNWF